MFYKETQWQSKCNVGPLKIPVIKGDIGFVQILHQICHGMHMGQFSQFGLNGFKRGQTHFSQLPISLDPEELVS